MKNIAGMMIPLMNCARQVTSKSCSLTSRIRSVTCSRRPKTVTSSCPVNASSTCPLSVPVCAHCALKSFCEREAMSRVTTTDTGMVSSAMIVSVGEIHSIMTRIATTVTAALSSWPKVCCSTCWTLSRSLVTRESTSPRGCLSK